MFTSRAVPLSQLIELCRRLRYNLGAGITLLEAFRQQSGRGPEPLRSVAGRVRDRLQTGDSLEDAIDREPGFPPLFRALAAVGERTGHLPEIFGSLEDYYTLQRQLRRTFLAQTALPAAQFVLAVCIVALLIWVLGVLRTTVSGVFGLSGTAGALIFVGVVFGAVLLVALIVRAGLRAVTHDLGASRAALRVPFVGPCLEAIALSRFALAMQLTLDSGMSITRAVRLSLEATGNPAFAAKAPEAATALKTGDDLSVALAGTGLFPEEFRNVLAVGEESGAVPEVMEKQFRHYHEEAERRLKALAGPAAWLVWLLYALFMVVLIFQLAGVYFRSLGL